MPQTLILDYETRSTVDLKKSGVDPYSKHPSTDVWCAAYAFDDGPVNVWRPGDPAPDDVRAHIESGGKVACHNFSFEQAVTRDIMHPRYGWPIIQPSQVIDTMAEAFAMALPGKLEGAGAALGLDMQKDMYGHRLMLQMCKPRSVKDGAVTWWDDSTKVDRLCEYAKADVESERELMGRVRRLSERERRVFMLDNEINNRGVYIDRPLVDAALNMLATEKKRLDYKMREMTRNKVTACTQTARLTEWVQLQGVETDAIAKSDIAELLEQDGVPQYVKQVLALRREANKSSTAKLQAMLDGMSPDGRVRNLFQYHGATTGRWGGRKLQTQNLPRGSIKWKNMPRAIDMIMRGDVIGIDNEFGSVMSTISSAIRPMLCAPKGERLIAADFSNIEGRVLAWYANEEWKLDAFRAYDAGTGPDLYNVAYARSFHVPVESVDDSQRQVGKCQELGLGFGGGVGAFQSMAKIYGVNVSDKRADELKTAWRDAHPNTRKFWYSVEEAALDAVRNPGVTYAAGVRGRQVYYRVAGSFLWCKLPSGRNLCYPYPKLVETTTPWGETRDALCYKTQDQFTKKWVEHTTWYGELVENLVSALARDLLVESMFNVTAQDYDIVMHVHDEIVSEQELGSAHSLRELEYIMSVAPSWAEGLPIAAKGWEGDRYRKG